MVRAAMPLIKRDCNVWIRVREPQGHDASHVRLWRGRRSVVVVVAAAVVVVAVVVVVVAAGAAVSG